MNATSESLSQMVNSGIDMLMIPGWNGLKPVADIVSAYKEALVNKTISVDRLNDAVARIVTVKLTLGVATLI